jgi:hypothetical protein
MKLSAKQNAVIWCLQNGWMLITSSEMKGAICCTDKLEFRISHTIFWNLHDKGLIQQQLQWPFDYKITELGKSIKTKPVQI